MLAGQALYHLSHSSSPHQRFFNAGMRNVGLASEVEWEPCSLTEQ
jgi:hypothetical protein